MFWVVIAQIVKTILTVKKYADILSSIASGQLVKGVISSFAVGTVANALAKAGIPLVKDTVQLSQLKDTAAGWLTQIIDETAGDMAKHGLVTAPEQLNEWMNELQADVDAYLERLINGKAIANGTSPHHSQTRSADPVVLHRGEFEREEIDLEISGAGMGFAFRRVYRSGAAYLGPLGQSWDHSYNLRLLEVNEFVLVRLTGDLAEDRFIQHPRFGEAEFSYYVPPDGLHDVIVPDGTGSFLMKRPKGPTFEYESTEQFGEHRIRRIEDRVGGFFRFEYSQEDRLQRIFINSDWRHVDFEYDEIGRLSRLVDHTGRSVVYTYDDWGYLDCVAGPTLAGERPAKLARYEYDYVGQVRKLARVRDWQDRIVVENEYDRDELSDYFGYLIRQVENCGETTFLYETLREEFDPALPVRDLPTLRVWESRRNGHQVEHIFNDLGNELVTRERFVEGCRFREAVTKFRYNADGEVIARLDPEGVLTQFLFSRDDLADSLPWPDIDPAMGDVPIKDRMSFGNLLAIVTRGQRMALAAAPLDSQFWAQGLPKVKMPDHPTDVVIKYRYDRDSQLLISTSDPRHTASADPLHVESSKLGEPNYDPTDPQFVDHQRHLTSTVYGPAPRFEQQRIIFPDRTRPSLLDGVTSVTGVIDEVRKYDANGRPLERRDARGYEWFNEYRSPSLDPTQRSKEGFIRRQLKPHLDLPFGDNTPDILEIQRNGTWKVAGDFFLSGGMPDDTITISVEGVRIALFQSGNFTDIISANPQVAVSVDGVPQPSWNQSMDAVYVLSDLPRGVHTIMLGGAMDIPFAIGRVRSHVSVDYEVDDLGRVVEEIDGAGHLTVNLLDVLGRKIKVTHGPAANPSVVHSEYDPGGRLIVERAEWCDETGQKRPEVAVLNRYHYDQAAFLVSESIGPELEGTRRITRHYYDAEANLRETLYPRGNRTYFDYDALNRQIRTVRAACSADRSVVTTTYELADHVLTQRNSRGAIHLNGYRDAGGVLQSGIDTRGRVRVRTDPLGHMEVTDYDALDSPTVVRQFQLRNDGQLEMLSRRETEYDEQGATIRIADAIFEEPIFTSDAIHAPDTQFLAAVNTGDVQSATTEIHLDAGGNTVAVRSAAGGIQRWRVDGQGRWYDQIDPEGRRTFRIHDANGNVTRVYAFEPVRDPVSGDLLRHEVFLQEHEYDEFNREVARIDSYGNRWQQQFDTLGNKTTSIDPLGNVVRLRHNAFREEVTRIQERTQTGLGGGAPLPALTTQLEYDDGGNLVALIDPLQRRTEFRFDGLNRLIETQFAVDQNGPRELKAYDRAGNLVTTIDRNGLVRKMQYDLLNQHSRTDIDASGVASGNKVSPLSASFASFRYDAAGNRTRHENDYCIVQIRRDSRGLPLSEKIAIQNIAAAPGQLEILQEFDLAGNRTKITYPSGREVVYAYDFLGRVTSVKNATSPADYPGRLSNAADADLARYAYVGRHLVRAECGNNLVLAVRLDGRGHVLERTVASDAGTLWRMQQLRDAAGYVRSESATTRTGERTRRFSLDSIYRLTHYQDGPAEWIDPVLVGPLDAPVDQGQSTDQAIIDASLGSLAVPASQPAFQYDGLGNRLESAEPGLAPFNSVPDQLNQYTQVNGVAWQYDRNGNLLSDSTHSFLYDLNDALQQVSNASTSKSLVTYYHDALGRVVAEATEAGTVFRIHDDASLLVEIGAAGRTEFAPGNRPDAVLHAAREGEDYWLFHDGLNSMRMLSNGSGDVVAMPLFRPFGGAEDNELTQSPLRLGFASMWYTTGLPFYNSNRRSYHPSVGRHLQRDPAGLADDLNPYTYARNSPIDFSDPTGLQAKKQTKVEEPGWIEVLGEVFKPVRISLYLLSRGVEYLPQWVPGVGHAVYSAVGLATSPLALSLDLLSVPVAVVFDDWDEGFGHTYMHSLYAKYLPGGEVASKVAGFSTEVITVTIASVSLLPVVGPLWKGFPGVGDLWRSAFQLSDAYDNAQGREIGSGARLNDSIWDLVYDKIGTNEPKEGRAFNRRYSDLYYEAFLQQPNQGRGRSTFFGFFSDDRPSGWGPQKREIEDRNRRSGKSIGSF